MSNKHIKLLESSEYKQLLKVRNRIVWPLVILVVGSYMSFILTVAFAPKFLGNTIGDSLLSLGIVAGIGLIFFMLLITIFYVTIANNYIEPLIKELRSQAEEK